MRLINEIFKKYTLKEETLIKYGFILNNNIYLYNKSIHNNSFELQIKITNKIIEGKLIDKDFNDEYDQINIMTEGTFISELKKECEQILIDIRNNCYYKEDFIYPQSNRLSNIIKEKYNVYPEYLWNTDPGFGVFRNPNTNKWFGIIMNIPKNKIIGKESKEIEVLDIMLSDKTSEYLNKKGIYIAYHMNKKNWVSIILDDTLADNEIISLINISYNNSNKKK